MALEQSHVRTPANLLDPQSSPPSAANQYQKRDRSQTLGTTFVSTAVVPVPSSADVLSSLISSLTLLSDSAREQIRSARQLEPVFSSRMSESVSNHLPSSSNNAQDTGSTSEVSLSPQFAVPDHSDGDEAEPPVAGYTRSRSSQRKQLRIKERWASYGSGKDKVLNLGRSGSVQTVRRPTSGTSSIGVPSIERAHNESSGSLPIGTAAGSKSPLMMFFPTDHDEEYFTPRPSSQRDVDVKSVRSFRTMRSKHSAKPSQEYEKENRAPEQTTPVKQRLPVTQNKKLSPEHKAYSHLSPANRDDLGEHLIPSRRSSMRHSPSIKGSTKGRSPSAGRGPKVRSRSNSTVLPGGPVHGPDDLPPEEEDSTLRRIRELQQAKEKRHWEWQKESSRTERSIRRSARNRSRTQTDGSQDSAIQLKLDKIAIADPDLVRHVPGYDPGEVESNPAPVAREIGLPSPALNISPAIPSPALSTPRKHKRSLSAGLRRSNSSRYGPAEDLRNISERVETYLSAPRLTQRIRHPRTGRKIAFSEVGDPDGFAVFCCVGMGLTRYVTSFYDDVARTQKLRLITPDRPGIGESSPYADGACTPLAWVDDVAIICQVLQIERFSLLAHSAGAIYALATALKMPDRIRGRIHLLAPWIPPSQFSSGSANGYAKAVNLPMAHKILSVLPAPFLKAANSRFLSATSASLEPRANKGSKKDRSMSSNYHTLLAEMAADIQPAALAADTASARHSSLSNYANAPTPTPPPYSYHTVTLSPPHSPSPTNMKRQFSPSAAKLRSPTPNEGTTGLTPQARQALLDSELTHRTWALATLNANPAVDLLICLERRRPIGFKYTDVTRGVVIHHGRKDARVPLDNIMWLSKVMNRCELRIIENEGHGLMASASVMSKVLTEIGREWEEWDVIAKEDEQKRIGEEIEKDKIRETERRRFIRQGH